MAPVARCHPQDQKAHTEGNIIDWSGSKNPPKNLKCAPCHCSAVPSHDFFSERLVGHCFRPTAQKLQRNLMASVVYCHLQDLKVLSHAHCRQFYIFVWPTTTIYPKISQRIALHNYSNFAQKIFQKIDPKQSLVGHYFGPTTQKLGRNLPSKRLEDSDPHIILSKAIQSVS